MRGLVVVVAVAVGAWFLLAMFLEFVFGGRRAVWVREGLLSLACLVVVDVVTGG